MKRERKLTLSVGFALALAMLAGVAWLNWHHTVAMHVAVERVDHTERVIDALDDLLSDLQDIETGARGFVITGEPAYLERFTASLGKVNDQFQAVRQLTRDNPQQQSACDLLEPLVTRRVALAQDLVELRRSTDFEAARKEVSTGTGKAVMDQIRAVLTGMEAKERQLLEQLSAAARRASRTNTLVTLGASGLSFALLLAVFTTTLRENRLRQRAEAEIERFFTLSLDMLGIAGADGYFKRVSPAFTQTLGWSAEEMLARPFLDFIHPDDRAASLAAVEQLVVRGEKLLQFENRYAHKDGSWRVLSWKAVPQPGGMMYCAARDVTERKQQEQNLRQQAALLDLALDAIVVRDLEDRIAFWNRSAERLYGFSREQALGRVAHQFFETIFPQPLADIMAEVAANGRWQGELIHRTADGRLVTVDSQWVQQTDAQGRKLAVLEINRDITESKRLEAQMAANLKALVDFKAALDEHAIVAITDARGKITYVNDKFCAISKYSRAELLGQDHRLINSGHHPKAFIRELWETIIHGRVWHGELKNRAKDGTFYWVDTTIVPFLGADGRPTQFIAIRADITGRKRVEEALRESEERRRLAAEAAGIGVWDWDIKSGVVRWDERMFALYGLPVSADGLAAYQVWRAAVLPAEIAEQEAVLQRTVATGGRSQREFRIVRASDQSVRFILAAELAVVDGAGHTTHVVGINLDITARKEAEQQIVQLHADLQHHAAQLQAANKELESFSYSVSHDLRAPLRHVQGYVQMLKTATEGQLSDKARRYLKTIHDASVDMGQLIDDLLSFSRMGRVELREGTVAPERLLKEALRGLEMATKDRRIEWEIAPLPLVTGDAAMLRQVLVNLVGNAVKYTRPRDPARIAIGTAGEENGRLIFFVRDNGVGFDPQYGPKLFGVFQRLHRADEFEGTGIGLANVRRIISRHGGRTWAEGRLNGGATFYFTLKPAGETTPPREQTMKGNT